MRRLVAIGVIGVLLALPRPGAAQEEEASDAPPSRAGLATITVTAQKREQTLEEVPVAVTAFSASDVEKVGLTNLTELMNVSANLDAQTSDTVSNGSTFRLRGVGTTGNNAGLEGSVGVFIDGVYLSRAGTALEDMLDVERIEVLRGPQGTLFGRNTNAGLISVVTKKPEYEWGGEAEATVGNHSYSKFSASITGPIIEEMLAFRLSGQRNRRDGIIHDLVTGQKYNERDRYSLRGQLLFDPTDRLSLRVIGDISSSEEDCCMPIDTVWGATAPLASALGSAVFNQPGPPSPRRALSNRPQESEVDNWGLSGELGWDFDWGTLTLISAYRDYDTSSDNDIDFSDVDIWYREDQDVRVQTFTQEVRLSGSWENLDWMVGGYYLNEDIDFGAKIFFGTQYETWINSLTGGAIPAFTGLPPGSIFPAGNHTDDDYNQDTDAWALFTHNALHLTDRLDLTLGLRYSDEDKDAKADFRTANPGCPAFVASPASLVLPPPTFAAIAGAACITFISPLVPQAWDQSFDDDAWSGTAKLSYLFSDDFSVYAGYSRGFKSGGFNLDRGAAIAVPLNPNVVGEASFESEDVDNWEVGFKTRLLDNRLMLNGAAYYAKYDNFQILEFTGVQFIVRNLDTMRSRGFEFEATALPWDSLLVHTAVARNNAEYGHLGGQFANLSGKQITNAPEWVVTGSATYSFDVPGTSLRGFLYGGFRWSDDRSTGTDLDPIKDDDSYTWWNGRIGIGAPDERWSVELWGRNLTDEDVYSIIAAKPIQSGSFMGFRYDRRTYGVTVRFKY